MHTPGHTLESTSYLLKDSEGKDIAIFTGDCVFLGEVGRPDLAVAGKVTKEDLAGMLYDSVQKIKLLNHDIRVYPGHGAGSSCGKAISGGNFSDVGSQIATNYGFQFKKREEFVASLTANLPQPPNYFFFDAALNHSGPSHYHNNYEHANKALTKVEFSGLMGKVKVIDTRVKVEKGIIKGVYWFTSKAVMLNFISYFIKPEEELLVIADQGKASDMIELLLRIGYFHIKGYNGFDAEELEGNWVKPTILKAEDVKKIDNPFIVDIRKPPEIETNGMINNATPIQLKDIEDQVEQLRGKNNIVTQCMGGVRARAAWSILAKHDVNAAAMDEEFKDLKGKGLEIVPWKQ